MKSKHWKVSSVCQRKTSCWKGNWLQNCKHSKHGPTIKLGSANVGPPGVHNKKECVTCDYFFMINENYMRIP